MATVILLAGVLATLGAVWSFVGFTGQIIVGLGDDIEPDVFLATGYADFARPMQYLGMAMQAASVALLLRVIVDTARAWFATRPSVARVPDVAA